MITHQVCLPLFIMFRLIAIICESSDGMTEVRDEIQPPGQRGDLELRKEPRVLVALDSGGRTVVTVRHRLRGGNLVSAEFARITGTRTRITLFPTTFSNHYMAWKGAP